MWFAVRSACSRGLSFSFGEGSYNILFICHFMLISKFVCIPVGCTLLNKLNGKCILLKWFAIVPGGFWLWLHEIGCNLIACNKVGSNHFTYDCHQPLTTSQAILIFPSWPELPDGHGPIFWPCITGALCIWAYIVTLIVTCPKWRAS